MMSAGLDLCGLNSLGCVRQKDGTRTFLPSALPGRASCVILPLLRKEGVMAGDDALRSERGLGLEWPPLAMAPQTGWRSAPPPWSHGRVLLAEVWHALLTKANQWSEAAWSAEELPVLTKPPPSECLAAEVRKVLGRVSKPESMAAVLAIPNQLPEAAQESVLRSLPEGSRLVWRAVAAAMSWAEQNEGSNLPAQGLAVIDAGFYGVEVSIFAFRRQEADGRVFQVPVRRLKDLRWIDTGILLADSPAPFLNPVFEGGWMEKHLDAIKAALRGQHNLLLCGPAAPLLLSLLQRRLPRVSWPAVEANAVADGASLLDYRLQQDLPTYLDLLPSLELFTLTSEREPNWLTLIPDECEVAGGKAFEKEVKRRIFIERNKPKLSNWLQRAGESEFRKVTTALPAEAPCDVWLDMRVTARSAGGFAEVCLRPSHGEMEVFGERSMLLLDWQNMERVSRGPGEIWPPGEVLFGWPDCGELYAHPQLFHDFLALADRVLGRALEHPVEHLRLQALSLLKAAACKTIPAQAVEGNAAPVNSLLCFSTSAPCKLFDVVKAGGVHTFAATPIKDDAAHRIATQLWNRLRDVIKEKADGGPEEKALIYILGRMGAYAPDDFSEYLAREFSRSTGPGRLFAAGRVFCTAAHGRRVFAAIWSRAESGQRLNLNWLRLIVYFLYQQPEALRHVPREHALAAASGALEVLTDQLKGNKLKQLFNVSLRTLALLLRIRRHEGARDFLSPDSKCSDRESRLFKDLNELLDRASGKRLPDSSKLLLLRLKQWLEFKANTGVMPPIAPPDEESDSSAG